MVLDYLAEGRPCPIISMFLPKMVYRLQQLRKCIRYVEKIWNCWCSKAPFLQPYAHEGVHWGGTHMAPACSSWK